MSENNPLLGRNNVGKLLVGFIYYTVLSSLIVFAIRFGYTAITNMLGFSIIIIDIFIWIFLITILAVVANSTIKLFKIENAKAFSRVAFVSAIIITIVYYVSQSIGLIVVNYGFSVLSLDSILVVTADIFGTGMSISRRLNGGISLPAFFNYIFAIVVFISFALAKGEFDFNEGLYIDGKLITFKKYFLFSKEPITLGEIGMRNDLYLLTDKEAAGSNLLEGNYNTFYVSEDPNHKVCSLFTNDVKEKDGVYSLQFNSQSDHYFTLPCDHTMFVANLRKYEDIVNAETKAPQVEVEAPSESANDNIA